MEELLPDYEGGIQQITSRIAYNEIDVLLYFRENSENPDALLKDAMLMRECDRSNIPTATNIATAETVITALDRAIEGLERQIRKNKTRLERTVRRGAFIITDEDDDEFAEEGEFEIRVKTFPVKPMATEEAILQMNLIDHDFYVFRDADSGEVLVVYKRREGGYGLIVPEE